MEIGKYGRSVLAAAWVLAAAAAAQFAQADQLFPFIFPEQRQIGIRLPAELPPAAIPNTPPPETVANNRAEAESWQLTLDEAIRTALSNTEVVRILAGLSTTVSGGTIYDTAIVNVTIDEQQARFDPFVQANNVFLRNEQPQADFTLLPPVVGGTRSDTYDHDFDLSKTTASGGTLNLGVRATPSEFRPSGIEQSPSSVDLSYRQPLLQGGGWRANMAPIVLARIDTERSFFQFKDSVQEQVRGVIDAYWRLVLARVNVWVREQQVQQLEEAVRLANARFKTGAQNRGPLAQARVSLLNFRTTLLNARAEQLNLEAGLMNILGFPPGERQRIIPTTPPVRDRLTMEWQTLIELASVHRPDIIELKLILEADQQRLLQAENQAHPRVDALALYRWNGLEGEVPTLGRFASVPGQFTDWTMSVNFSVPLGLRSERANVRRQELLISRDRAILAQGLHNTAHILAVNLRNLDQFYEQYLLFKQTRPAARFNVDQQQANLRSDRGIFLDVLQSIADWGNAVNSEAQAVLQYNLELAALERQTGTILESHGIRFFEERFGAVGPLGRHHDPQYYPAAMHPSVNDDRYEPGNAPAEESFELRSFFEDRERMREQREGNVRPKPPASPIVRPAPPPTMVPLPRVNP